jgi:hypothetical protein
VTNCFRTAGWIVAIAVAVLLVAARPGSAQQLEPRAYSPSPVGANFVGLGYAHSSGNVLLDPSLPLTDVTARVDLVTPYYLRTFGLLGRTASLGLVLPYAWGTAEGNLFEERRRADRTGLADMPVRMAVNLIGGPALSLREFVARKPRTSLGASLVVSVPTGQYDPSKLVNLGANRWSFKPELGFSHPWRRWWLEAYAGAWLFTDNDDFFGGQHREQEPLGVLQGHVVRGIGSRMWAAFDATWYYGGDTTVNGVPNADRQENSRLGVTLALPVMGRHTVKLAWAKGISARSGSDLETLAVAWQYAWFDGMTKPAGR